MLRLLTSGAPIALLMTVAAVPAGAAGWFAHGLKFNLVDRPAITREATSRAEDACAIRVSAAANAAEQAERARQSAASAAALRSYQTDLAASQQRAAEANLRLDLEILDYETKRAADGRACPLSQSDLDFVYGRIPAGPAGGR